MIDIIISLIAFSAVWVYFDATKNKIGKIQDEKGIFNMSAGAWAIVTLFLWIIAFPSYLIKRSSLIDKAKENPIDVNGRSAEIAALSVTGVLWIVMTGCSLTSPVAIQASEKINPLFGFRYVNLEITSLVDEVEITNVIINKGNCKPGYSANSLPKNIKYGQIFNISAAAGCKVINVKVATNQGNWEYTF